MPLVSICVHSEYLQRELHETLQTLGIDSERHATKRGLRVRVSAEHAEGALRLARLLGRYASAAWLEGETRPPPPPGTRPDLYGLADHAPMDEAEEEAMPPDNTGPSDWCQDKIEGPVRGHHCTRPKGHAGDHVHSGYFRRCDSYQRDGAIMARWAAKGGNK